VESWKHKEDGSRTLTEKRWKDQSLALQTGTVTSVVDRWDDAGCVSQRGLERMKCRLEMRTEIWTLLRQRNGVWRTSITLLERAPSPHREKRSEPAGVRSGRSGASTQKGELKDLPSGTAKRIENPTKV